ncbi:MAG TPA: HAMP domain-containing protein, partial [Pyrinomonadaceae bacterium]
MGIRSKLFLVFFTCGIIPMLVFVIANYLNGTRAVEDLLRQNVEREASALASNIETALRDRESALTALSRSDLLRNYLHATVNQTSGAGAGQSPSAVSGGARAQPVATPSPAFKASDGGGEAIPSDVRAAVEAILSGGRNDYAALACLGTDGRPLFRVESVQREAGGAGLRYQTKDFLANSVAPDARVWTTAEQTPLRSTLSQQSFGAAVRYTIPVFTNAVNAQAERGALVVDVKLSALCKSAIGGFAATLPQPRLFVVLDGGGGVVCYTNEAQLYQPVMSVMPPSFKAVADAMLKGESGQKFFDSLDGDRWLAGYQPIRTIGLSLGVAANETLTLQHLRREGWLSIILSALAGLVAAVLLTLLARRMERSIERVTAGAVAIAGGQLDQRIEVRSSDETRLLAESFNRMSDRLREQIAHEAETKQFESFMRLAAMLTHDLKNAITALSLVVSNMEQQFDNKEFRAEAMESLKESTNKLRLIVAKLSGPVESLSGEYQRPRPTDLVPHFKRVLGATAEAQAVHGVVLRLPPALIATVDGERIEKVFENLVLNALEAMGTESGTLTIE